jgi:NIMA (never in mitosis gene a)-related kinase 1/4/5
VITNRIKGFLTETIRNQEFSHTALHNLKIDVRMRMEDVKQVKNEEPMPADMLRQQMLKEKKDKEVLEKIEKDKMDKNRLEKERMDKIRQDAERKLELERKADQERKEKEKQLEAEKIKNLKNAILFPGEKERDRSPLLRNAITPTAGNNNKGPTKIEFPNAPYTPGILNRNNNNRPFDIQPKTPAYNKPDLNKEFNPFLKNDVNKVVVKPIFYANPNKEAPKPENRDISPLKATPEIKRINSTESSENKVPEKIEKIEKVDSNEKPSVSPRNITPIFPKESEKVKDNKSKDPEEKKNRNVLKDLIEENRNKREQFQQELDKKKQELAIEKTESEKRRLEYEAKLEENRKKREKDSQNMKEDIKMKKSMIKKNRDEQFDVEVYIPGQDSSSDEEDEIDEREEITPTEKKSSPPEEEKETGSAKDKEETPAVDNDITMEEENLINMINEMKQIVIYEYWDNEIG